MANGDHKWVKLEAGDLTLLAKGWTDFGGNTEYVFEEPQLADAYAKLVAERPKIRGVLGDSLRITLCRRQTAGSE